MNDIDVPQETAEFGSGQEVEPGLYVDVETGALVRIQERDELPEVSRLIRYRRRFYRIDEKELQVA